MKSLVLIALLQAVLGAEVHKEGPILKLPGLGKLRGRLVKTLWTQREVKQFVDVKYAESPSGVNRFKAPQPIQPWEGVKNAADDGIGCPSVMLDYVDDPFGVFDFEDCLSLTVSSANLSASQPVMVYLHGEYLYEGNSLEGAPEYLLEKDIVLVSLQYRLGPFGFLSTNTPEIPGNAAVFDVVLALQWIKHFIPYFGGDPNSVTLFGQVGGAALAHLLTFSPAVPKGLFHRVIYHSGSALMPAFLAENPLVAAKEIGSLAGCSAKNVDELNLCLLTAPTRDILKGFSMHTASLSDSSSEPGGVQFTIGGPSGVLPEHPAIMLMEEKNFSYPTMGGTPRNAGSRVMKEMYAADFDNISPDEVYKGEDYINHVMIQSVGLDDKGLLTSFLTREFFNDEMIRNGTFNIMAPGLIDLLGTVLHKIPVLLALRRNAKFMPESTFLYSFDYRGEFNRYPDFKDGEEDRTPFRGGVSLTDENIYLFPYPDHVMRLNANDTKMAIKMVELWTSFAETGQPDVNWPAMTNMNGPYLKIDKNLKIGSNYFREFSATVRDQMQGISIIKDL